MASPLVIFLHSSSYDRLFQAVNLLVTASTMGSPCYLFLFYGALATYLDGSWDDVAIDSADPPPAWAQTLTGNFELADTPSLYEVLAMARREPGGLTVCACSTSMNMLSLEPGEVAKKVDQIIGHASMLEIAARAGRVFYI